MQYLIQNIWMVFVARQTKVNERKIEILFLFFQLLPIILKSYWEEQNSWTYNM